MGPQLYRCGNGMDPAVKVDFFGLLQWGRNFIVAEMRRVAATITFQEMLQWGRNFIVAEITAMPASHISRCFNGAATLSLRKSITGEYGHALQSFNGAASMGPMGPQLYRCGNLGP